MSLYAYPPVWAFRSALRGHAARWQRQELLSPDQLARIEASYPLDFYRPAWPLRAGLFLFTWFGLAMAVGTVLLLTNGSPVAAGVLCCIGCIAVLELLIRERRFYRCGIDNALLYAGLSAAIGLIFYAYTNVEWSDNLQRALDPRNGWPLLPLLLTLGLLIAAVVRYADPLIAAAAVVVGLLLAALFALQFSAGAALLPFLLMAVAGGGVVLRRVLVRRLAKSYTADYYAGCLTTLKVLALVAFYLAGNYLLVREGNAALLHQYPSGQIPFAFVFYALTAGVPVLYIVLGLRRADRPMLLIGIAALGFSFFTLRYYHSVMPPEIAALVAGLAFTVAAGLLIKAMRPSRWGYTSLADDEPRHFNFENLVQAQTAHVPDAPVGPAFEFGGGSSGGGGATGQF